MTFTACELSITTLLSWFENYVGNKLIASFVVLIFFVQGGQEITSKPLFLMFQSSQSLWNRLSVLLNFLPHENDLVQHGEVIYNMIFFSIGFFLNRLHIFAQ